MLKNSFIGYIKENVLALLNDNLDGTSDDIREEEEVRTLGNI